MVKHRRVSSNTDPSFFSYSDSALARILADFSDDNLDDDDDDATAIHHEIAPSAYTLFADSVFNDLELEDDDVSMAALEELSFVKVSDLIPTHLPSTSLTPSFNTNMEDDLVAAL
jgi:hypothetical protein